MKVVKIARLETEQKAMVIHIEVEQMYIVNNSKERKVR